MLIYERLLQPYIGHKACLHIHDQIAIAVCSGILISCTADTWSCDLTLVVKEHLILPAATARSFKIRDYPTLLSHSTFGGKTMEQIFNNAKKKDVSIPLSLENLKKARYLSTLSGPTAAISSSFLEAAINCQPIKVSYLLDRPSSLP